MMIGKISIAIPVLNEERNIQSCLKRIFDQEYNEKLEVFIVDAGCMDKTIEIAKKFKVKILDNTLKKDYDSGKMIALKESTGEFFMYLDADMFLENNNWFNLMTEPLKNKKISASFTKFVVNNEDNALNRYLSYDSLQRDPLYKFLTPGIESILIKKEKGYFIANIREKNPVPVGLCLYRTQLLKKYIQGEEFQDLEVPLILNRRGYGTFAYVPNAGVNHRHVKDIKHLLSKRMRNLDIDNKGKVGYIPNYEKRLFKWVNLKSKTEIIRLALWIIYVTLLAPLIMQGVYKMIKNRDSAFALEPIVGLFITYAVSYVFLKNKKARRLLLR